eukprot:jgi/Botrbrau1/15682/Bobra.4_1s0061.1
MANLRAALVSSRLLFCHGQPCCRWPQPALFQLPALIRWTKNKVPHADLPFWDKCGNVQPPDGYTEPFAHGNSILGWLCVNVVQCCKLTRALMIPDPEGRPHASMFRNFEPCSAEERGVCQWTRVVGKDGSDGVGRATDCVDLTTTEDDDDIMVDRCAPMQVQVGCVAVVDGCEGERKGRSVLEGSEGGHVWGFTGKGVC